MFATGIDTSAPVITDQDGRSIRQDELEKCDHYRRWRDDLRLVQELGIRYLRYGPPLHRAFVGPGRYDWAFTDDTFGELRRLEIVPIADLCHFGLPDWLGNSFQNPDFPRYFAEYARAFAERYPWVRYYTPVNEVYLCAKFSALLGWWNERLRGEQEFVMALKHMCLASLSASEQILAVQPDAVFIQSESSEYFLASTAAPQATKLADFENQRRFLALDFLYAHPLRGDVERYARAHGVSDAEMDNFMNHDLGRQCVMGNDYYFRNEHFVRRDGRIEEAGALLGWFIVTHEYYQRYKKPLMLTETSLEDPDEAPRWLRCQWHNVLYMRGQGVPVLGFTWYPLVDHVDMDTALREDGGRVNCSGLVDLDRRPHPVAHAYRALMEDFSEVPVVPNAPFFAVP